MESAPRGIAQTRTLVSCTRRWNCACKEHVTNSEIALTSRFHGLINFFVIIYIYTKEVYGFVDFWDDTLLV